MGHIFDCTGCEGTGQVTVELPPAVDAADDAVIETEQQACIACDGSGVLCGHTFTVCMVPKLGPAIVAKVTSHNGMRWFGLSTDDPDLELNINGLLTEAQGSYPTLRAAREAQAAMQELWDAAAEVLADLADKSANVAAGRDRKIREMAAK